MEMKVVCNGEKPSYANEHAAGLDLRSNNEVTIYPNTLKNKIKRLIDRKNKYPYIVDIDTRLSMEIPKGYCGFVIPRSGLGFNRRITLINDIGLIDEDYRGNIGVRLLNEGKEPYTICQGDRVAQMVIVPYIQPKLLFVDELSETQRGKGGFGHTGR
ncbi:dUTP diphosphatase [Tissierella sp.]|uniref:dUTP diphosphatase n=1 Tax=Tissierella sp. TaxID=41274 RepID=UPI002862F85E|nr:dUTP diphosphatase [Tissierella sp.]MDR7856046.1 dUTP diphosphatase [Tissierella sp.]